MAYEIEWSLEARKKALDELYDHLETRWNDKVITDFSDLLEEKLKLISENPKLYKSSAR